MERREGWPGHLPELTACCCGMKGSWRGGSEAAKAASKSGCWRGESHCHVWSAWRGVQVVGGIRSVRVRSEVREVILDAWREKSEERASSSFWRSEEVIAPERGLVREPLWGRE